MNVLLGVFLKIKDLFIYIIKKISIIYTKLPDL